MTRLVQILTIIVFMAQSVVGESISLSHPTLANEPLQSSSMASSHSQQQHASPLAPHLWGHSSLETADKSIHTHSQPATSSSATHTAAVHPTSSVFPSNDYDTLKPTASLVDEVAVPVDSTPTPATAASTDHATPTQHISRTHTPIHNAAGAGPPLPRTHPSHTAPYTQPTLRTDTDIASTISTGPTTLFADTDELPAGARVATPNADASTNPITAHVSAPVDPLSALSVDADAEEDDDDDADVDLDVDVDADVPLSVSGAASTASRGGKTAPTAAVLSSERLLSVIAHGIHARGHGLLPRELALERPTALTGTHGSVRMHADAVGESVAAAGTASTDADAMEQAEEVKEVADIPAGSSRRSRNGASRLSVVAASRGKVTEPVQLPASTTHTPPPSSALLSTTTTAAAPTAVPVGAVASLAGGLDYGHAGALPPHTLSRKRTLADASELAGVAPTDASDAAGTGAATAAPASLPAYHTAATADIDMKSMKAVSTDVGHAATGDSPAGAPPAPTSASMRPPSFTAAVASSASGDLHAAVGDVLAEAPMPLVQTQAGVAEASTLPEFAGSPANSIVSPASPSSAPSTPTAGPAHAHGDAHADTHQCASVAEAAVTSTATPTQATEVDAEAVVAPTPADSMPPITPSASHAHLLDFAPPAASGASIPAAINAAAADVSVDTDLTQTEAPAAVNVAPAVSHTLTVLENIPSPASNATVPAHAHVPHSVLGADTLPSHIFPPMEPTRPSANVASESEAHAHMTVDEKVEDIADLSETVIAEATRPGSVSSAVSDDIPTASHSDEGADIAIPASPIPVPETVRPAESSASATVDAPASPLPDVHSAALAGAVSPRHADQHAAEMLVAEEVKDVPRAAALPTSVADTDMNAVGSHADVPIADLTETIRGVDDVGGGGFLSPGDSAAAPPAHPHTAPRADTRITTVTPVSGYAAELSMPPPVATTHTPSLTPVDMPPTTPSPPAAQSPVTAPVAAADERAAAAAEVAPEAYTVPATPRTHVVASSQSNATALRDRNVPPASTPPALVQSAHPTAHLDTPAPGEADAVSTNTSAHAHPLQASTPPASPTSATNTTAAAVDGEPASSSAAAATSPALPWHLRVTLPELSKRNLHSRFNSAAADAGAKLLAAAKGLSKPANVLKGDADKYLVYPCKRRVWFVVQLSEDVVLDTVTITNREHYASGVRDFQLLGSGKWPTDKWIFLGNFRALDTHETQTFTLPQPDWVRYVKVRLLSHYREEEYCTMTSFHAFGSTMLESLQREMDSDFGKAGDAVDVADVRDAGNEASITASDRDARDEQLDPLAEQRPAYAEDTTVAAAKAASGRAPSNEQDSAGTAADADAGRGWSSWPYDDIAAADRWLRERDETPSAQTRTQAMDQQNQGLHPDTEGAGAGDALVAGGLAGDEDSAFSDLHSRDGARAHAGGAFPDAHRHAFSDVSTGELLGVPPPRGNALPAWKLQSSLARFVKRHGSGGYTQSAHGRREREHVRGALVALHGDWRDWQPQPPRSHADEAITLRTDTTTSATTRQHARIPRERHMSGHTRGERMVVDVHADKTTEATAGPRKRVVAETQPRVPAEAGAGGNIQVEQRLRRTPIATRNSDSNVPLQPPHAELSEPTSAHMLSTRAQTHGPCAATPATCAVPTQLPGSDALLLQLARRSPVPAPPTVSPPQTSTSKHVPADTSATPASTAGSLLTLALAALPRPLPPLVCTLTPTADFSPRPLAVPAAWQVRIVPEPLWPHAPLPRTRWAAVFERAAGEYVATLVCEEALKRVQQQLATLPRALADTASLTPDIAAAGAEPVVARLTVAVPGSAAEAIPVTVDTVQPRARTVSPATGENVHATTGREQDPHVAVSQLTPWPRHAHATHTQARASPSSQLVVASPARPSFREEVARLARMRQTVADVHRKSSFAAALPPHHASSSSLARPALPPKPFLTGTQTLLDNLALRAQRKSMADPRASRAGASAHGSAFRTLTDRLKALEAEAAFAVRAVEELGGRVLRDLRAPLQSLVAAAQYQQRFNVHAAEDVKTMFAALNDVRVGMVSILAASVDDLRATRADVGALQESVAGVEQQLAAVKTLLRRRGGAEDAGDADDEDEDEDEYLLGRGCVGDEDDDAATVSTEEDLRTYTSRSRRSRRDSTRTPQTDASGRSRNRAPRSPAPHPPSSPAGATRRLSARVAQLEQQLELAALLAWVCGSIAAAFAASLAAKWLLVRVFACVRACCGCRRGAEASEAVSTPMRGPKAKATSTATAVSPALVAVTRARPAGIHASTDTDHADTPLMDTDNVPTAGLLAAASELDTRAGALPALSLAAPDTAAVEAQSLDASSPFVFPSSPASASSSPAPASPPRAHPALRIIAELDGQLAHCLLADACTHTHAQAQAQLVGASASMLSLSPPRSPLLSAATASSEDLPRAETSAAADVCPPHLLLSVDVALLHALARGEPEVKRDGAAVIGSMGDVGDVRSSSAAVGHALVLVPRLFHCLLALPHGSVAAYVSFEELGADQQLQVLELYGAAVAPEAVAGLTAVLDAAQLPVATRMQLSVSRSSDSERAEAVAAGTTSVAAVPPRDCVPATTAPAVAIKAESSSPSPEDALPRTPEHAAASPATLPAAPCAFLRSRASLATDADTPPAASPRASMGWSLASPFAAPLVSPAASMRSPAAAALSLRSHSLLALSPLHPHMHAPFSPRTLLNSTPIATLPLSPAPIHAHPSDGLSLPSAGDTYTQLLTAPRYARNAGHIGNSARASCSDRDTSAGAYPAPLSSGQSHTSNAATRLADTASCETPERDELNDVDAASTVYPERSNTR